MLCWSSAARRELGTCARGWALTQSLEALVYYFDATPVWVAMACRVIRATLESTDKQLS